MTKSIRRIDRNKVNQIRRFRQDCTDIGIGETDIMFAEYKQIPDATRLEHASANYPLLAEDKSIRADMLKRHNRDVREFNKSLKDIDIEIVGVEYEVLDIHGNKMKIFFDELAEGNKAKHASDKCEPYIKGWKDKKKRLLDMSNDIELKHRHDTKIRQIRTLLRRKGKRY